MDQYRVNGQFRSRGKTYAKRAAVGLGGYATASALLAGTRRGRRLMGRVAAGNRQVGNTRMANAVSRQIKGTARFRRAVRGITGPLASKMHGLRAAGKIARMLR